MGTKLKPGDLVQVFYRMQCSSDNEWAIQEPPQARWYYSPSPQTAILRPRMGFTERWLPATVLEAVDKTKKSRDTVRIRWDVTLWFDWGTGERLHSSDPFNLEAAIPLGKIRPRSPDMTQRSMGLNPRHDLMSFLPDFDCSGARVKVSFVVFRWGSCLHSILYNNDSANPRDGSPISWKFINRFFDSSVVPKLGQDYEVFSVFITSSDDFDKISETYVVSQLKGERICALYFLWPMKGQQSYLDNVMTISGYVDEGPWYNLVRRMESVGLVTRWPHHLDLWKLLSSKRWLTSTSMSAKYHVPLVTTIHKAVALQNPRKAAEQAIESLARMQEAISNDEYENRPQSCNWDLTKSRAELMETANCVVKLGFSYEGTDVCFCTGLEGLAHSIVTLVASQPGYTNESVFVQQVVKTVDIEFRVFVLNNIIISTIYTYFSRINKYGFVRDYQKMKRHEVIERMEGDEEAFLDAERQVEMLVDRWNVFFLQQAADGVGSVRMDFLVQRVGPKKCDVWTCELGEQGYLTQGVEMKHVFDSIIDTVLE